MQKGLWKYWRSKESFDFDQAEDKDLEPEQICPACPKCGSENVEYAKFSRILFYLGIALFRFPFPCRRKNINV